MGQSLPEVRDHTLVRPIGQGAFGHVWLARNAVGTYRAVKLVSRSFLDGEADFKREFNGIQRFEPVSRQHAGLVDVLQIGRAADDSYFYYVMELGDDAVLRQEFAPDDYRPRTLSAERRLRTRIPALEAALIGAQLADALGFLHDQGLIHRDIKPSNVLFVQGHPRIGDPGLVTSIEASQSLGGTLGYIAPEGPGTPQADIFGLGKLLYVISTGKDPGEFPMLPPEMTTYADAADLRRLNHVILRACAYNPKDRYRTAPELRQDLLEVHAGGSPGETRRRLRLAKRIGVGLFILLLLIFVGYYRANLQAKAERARLAKTYLDAATRLQQNNDSIGALRFLGAMLKSDPENPSDLVARRIGFVWRHSPRLIAQWYFTNAINRVAFDPSGFNLAIASASGEVWLWPWLHADPPKLLGQHTKSNGTAEAECVAFGDNGRWLASVGNDRMLRLWATNGPSTNKLEIRLPGESHAVAWHPTARTLAVSSGLNVLMVDPETRKQTRLLSTSNLVSAIAISPDGSSLVAGDLDGNIIQQSLTNEGERQQRRLRWIYGASFNSAGTMLALANGFRAHLNPFDKVTPARLRHGGLVRSVCFAPRGQTNSSDRLLTSCLDNTIRLWSCSEDEELMAPIRTEREPTGAVFGPDGSTFAVFTVGGLLRVYALTPTMQDDGNNRSALSGDGLTQAQVEGTNVLLSAASDGRVTNQFSVEASGIYQVELDRTGQTMLVRPQYSEKRDRIEIRTNCGRTVVAGTNIEGSFWATLSPAGDCVAIRQHHQLVLWRPREGTAVIAQPWNVSDLYDIEVRFDFTGSRLVAGWSNEVVVFEATSGATVARWALRYPAKTVDLDPTGKRVVIGESPPGFAAITNYVWDVASRQPVSPPLIGQDGVFVARFSPNGRSVIITDQRGNFILYDTGSQKVIPVQQEAGMVTDASFSADGGLVATATADRGIITPSVQVWEVATGDPVTPPLKASRAKFGRVRIGANGDLLTWVTQNGDWRRWDLRMLTAPSDALADLTRLLSCQEITAAGASVSLPGAELDRLWRKLSVEHADWFTMP